MAHQLLSLDSIGRIGGGAAELIINSAIANALADTNDRGEDEKPRKVIITLNMVRMPSGDLAVDLEAAAKLPTFRTTPTLGKIKIDPKSRRQALDMDLSSTADETEESEASS